LKPYLLASSKLATEEEIVSELIDRKSSGFFGRFNHYPTVREFKARAIAEKGGVLAYSKNHFRVKKYPAIYLAKMKTELVPHEKLIRRKQRMFLIMCKEHVTVHKYFFSSQNKALRLKDEIAHGQTWFYGYVNRFAQELTRHDEVASEDDEFWDKSFCFAKAVYWLQRRALLQVVELTPDDLELLDVCINNCIECITVLPTGDVVSLRDVNPSGKDATTETNCIARCLIEAYMQIKYYQHIEHPIDSAAIVRHHVGTKYLGDDRIAGSADYPPGYLKFYRENVHVLNVRVKTYVVTKGPDGAEFAGFTFAKAAWDQKLCSTL